MSARLMRDVTTAFEQSDLRPLLDALHPNIIWKSATNDERLLRFGGIHVGLLGARKVLAIIAADYQFRRFKPIDIIEKGEIAWGLFDAVIEHLPTARKRSDASSVAFECAIRWRIRRGKILEHQAFFDTAAVRAAAN